MSDRERILYYLGGLVAAFVLAWFVGAALAPVLGLGSDHPSPGHAPMSEMTP
ncbi:MAG: hypothetical protein KDB63_04395 [Nocardioidaceae bacterium]|nr:hypothetical protein [Nocardioidaceae bacterium]